MILSRVGQKNNSQLAESQQLIVPKIIHNLAPIRNQSHSMWQSYKFQDKCNNVMHDPELAGGQSAITPNSSVNGPELDERSDSKSKIKIRMYGSKRSLCAYTATLLGNQTDSKLVSECQGRKSSLIHAETVSNPKRPASTSHDRNKKKVIGCRKKLPPSLTMIDQNTNAEVILYNSKGLKFPASPRKSNSTLRIVAKQQNKTLKKHALYQPKVIGRQIKISAYIDEVSPEFQKISRLKIERSEQAAKQQKKNQFLEINLDENQEAKQKNAKREQFHGFNIDNIIQAQKKFLYEQHWEESKRDSQRYANPMSHQENENKVNGDLVYTPLIHEIKEVKVSKTIKEVHSQTSEDITVKLQNEKNCLLFPKIPSVILTPNKRIKAHFGYVDPEKSPRAGRRGHFLEQKNPVRILILNKSLKAETNYIDEREKIKQSDTNQFFKLPENIILKNIYDEQKLFPEKRQQSHENEQMNVESSKTDLNLHKKPSFASDSNKNIQSNFQFIDFNDSFAKPVEGKKLAGSNSKTVLNSVKSIDAYFEYINQSQINWQDEQNEAQMLQYIKMEIGKLIELDINKHIQGIFEKPKPETIFQYEELQSRNSIDAYDQRFQSIGEDRENQKIEGKQSSCKKSSEQTGRLSYQVDEERVNHTKLESIQQIHQVQATQFKLASQQLCEKLNHSPEVNITNPSNLNPAEAERMTSDNIDLQPSMGKSIQRLESQNANIQSGKKMEISRTIILSNQQRQIEDMMVGQSSFGGTLEPVEKSKKSEEKSLTHQNKIIAENHVFEQAKQLGHMHSEVVPRKQFPQQILSVLEENKLLIKAEHTNTPQLVEVILESVPEKKNNSFQIIQNQGEQVSLKQTQVKQMGKKQFENQSLSATQIQAETKNQDQEGKNTFQIDCYKDEKNMDTACPKILRQLQNLQQNAAERITQQEQSESRRSQENNIFQSLSPQNVGSNQNGSPQKYLKLSSNQIIPNSKSQVSIVKKVSIYKLKQNKENFSNPRQIIIQKKDAESTINQEKKNSSKQKITMSMRKNVQLGNKIYSPVPKYINNIKSSKVTSPYLSSTFAILKIYSKKQNSQGQEDGRRNSLIEKKECLMESFREDEKKEPDDKKLKKESLAKRNKKSNTVLYEKNIANLKKLKTKQKEEQKIEEASQTAKNLNIQFGKNKRSEHNNLLKSPYYSKSDCDQLESNEKFDKQANQSHKKIKKASYGVGKKRDVEVHEYISEARKELQQLKNVLP